MNIDNILNCFPIKIKEQIINNITTQELNNIEEIHIRNNLPIILNLGQAEKVIKYIVNSEEIEYIFQKICENSIYSYQNQITNGYITIKGGNRVGLVGTAVIKDGKVTNFNYISSLNFRVSRQIIGCSDKIIEEIINRQEDSIYNTLIISAPGKGKTTLLRDIVRNISNGIPEKLSGKKITVIDERGEISATYKGISQNDLGIRTDVINDIPKHIGMRMAIRSMAPQVIIADEIGSKEDADSIKYALCCGVKGIFTAHGQTIEEITNNPELNDLIKSKVFEKIIKIERESSLLKIEGCDNKDKYFTI
ncbi:MAG: stage III sporulation protein AA [Clostridia bacterium]